MASDQDEANRLIEEHNIEDVNAVSTMNMYERENAKHHVQLYDAPDPEEDPRAKQAMEDLAEIGE
jgi:hypothetical protein